jgi:hypothetical protein
LQFDGWKQRHWTLPFRGQRFSIVWFTPKGLELQQALLARGASFAAAAASLPLRPAPSLSTDPAPAAEPSSDPLDPRLHRQGAASPWENADGAVRQGRLWAVRGRAAVPLVFGTFKLNGAAAADAVQAALTCSFRGGSPPAPGALCCRALPRKQRRFERECGLQGHSSSSLKWGAGVSTLSSLVCLHDAACCVRAYRACTPDASCFTRLKPCSRAMLTCHAHVTKVARAPSLPDRP